jgi:hypothetical protein
VHGFAARRARSRRMPVMADRWQTGVRKLASPVHQGPSKWVDQEWRGAF